MSFASGDIVLIPDAPYTNRLDVKARPCLVISGSQFNKINPDVILAPISSNIRFEDPKQVIIQTDNPVFTQTGLKYSSAIKCGAIFAYTKNQIRRKLGTVPVEVLNEVRKIIVDILTTD